MHSLPDDFDILDWGARVLEDDPSVDTLTQTFRGDYAALGSPVVRRGFEYCFEVPVETSVGSGRSRAGNTVSSSGQAAGMERKVDAALTRESSATDAAAKLVLDALGNTRWDFRTVTGIARDTGLTEEQVKVVMECNRGLIREALTPGLDGAILYTLRMRHPRLKEYLAALRFALAKTTD